MGRRGVISDMFEVIISFVLLGMFALFSYGYITTHANGEAFYARFYAIDISTTAELANAGAGDVVLRYDNIKPNLDISFWVDNGKVTAGRTTTSGVPPVDARAYFYGRAPDYPTGALFIKRPQYLVLRKSGEGFAITEAETLLQACPVIAKRAVELDEALVHVNVLKSPTGTYASAIGQAFSDTLPSIKTTVRAEESPNIVFDITVEQGDKNSIDFGPTGEDGAVFACAFKDQLAAVTLLAFEANTPTRQSGTAKMITIPITITMSGSSYIKPEQVGIALANALAIYYRGASVTERASTTAPTMADATKGDILLIGDSLTAKGGGYTDYLKSCGGRKIVTAAAIGKWSKTMSNEIDALIVSKPSTVVIWGGTNDIVGGGVQSSYVITNLESMRAKTLAKNPDAAVIFITIPPFKGYSSKDADGNPVTWTDSKQKSADRVNEWIRANGGIDMNSLVLDKNNDTTSDYYKDGLHPNVEGTRLVAQEVKKRLGCPDG